MHNINTVLSENKHILQHGKIQVENFQVTNKLVEYEYNHFLVDYGIILK